MNSEDVPAGPSWENQATATLRGFAEVALANFNSSRDALEAVELADQGLLIREEDHVLLQSAREAARRLEALMDRFCVDMTIAQNNYASFVTAEASLRESLDSTDPKGKVHASLLDAILDIPKNIRRSFPSRRRAAKTLVVKPIKQHNTSFVFCQRLSFGLWKLLDALNYSAEHHPNADPRNLEPKVKLAKLIPLKILEDNSDSLTALQLTEILLNDVTEHNNVAYLYGPFFSDTFVGDTM
jgi:hypothetical protein